MEQKLNELPLHIKNAIIENAIESCKRIMSKLIQDGDLTEVLSQASMYNMRNRIVAYMEPYVTELHNNLKLQLDDKDKTILELTEKLNKLTQTNSTVTKSVVTPVTPVTPPLASK